MDMMEHNGEMYKRQGKLWSDMDGLVVCEILQGELNAKYVQKMDLSKLSIREVIQQGDKFKNSGSLVYALRFYEYTAENGNNRELASILPRMTSCYRKQGRPQKAIDILEYASKKYGKEMIGPVLLTSAAAAYCDLREYEKARKCCARAFAALNGEESRELSAVYGRLQKESGEKK